MTTASRLEYLKIKMFQGMPGRTRNDPWLYLSKKAGPLVPTQHILQQPTATAACRGAPVAAVCRLDQFYLKSRIWTVSQITITYI